MTVNKVKTETDISRDICRYLEEKGFFFWRNNNMPVLGRSFPKWARKGIPDIFMVRTGVFYGIEVKRAADPNVREANGRKLRGGTLSVDQIKFMNDMVNNGGRYLVVTSLEQLKDEFEKFRVPLPVRMGFIRHNEDGDM